MPPSPAFADTVRTTVTYTLPNSDIAQNVIHWSVGSGAVVDMAFASDLANEIHTAWGDTLQGIQAIGVSFYTVRVDDLRTTPYPSWTFNYNDPALNSVVAMPMQMAAVISLHTTHPGRRGRGRIYIAGLCEDANVAGGVLSGAVVAQINAFGTELLAITTADSQDVLLGVLSRLDAVCYAVETTSVDTRWDVQRRRANRRLT